MSCSRGKSGSRPTQACWQQKHRQLFCCCWIWTCGMQLFSSLAGNHHQDFYVLQSFDVCLWRKGREQWEHERNGLWPDERMLLFRCPSLLFCHLLLFLDVPGMPPVFLCSNYSSSKLCQRAEIVLIRGPPAFASVIWWVSLGTRKTRLTIVYVATSEPRGQLGVFLAPSR